MARSELEAARARQALLLRVVPPKLHPDRRAQIMEAARALQRGETLIGQYFTDTEAWLVDVLAERMSEEIHPNEVCNACGKPRDEHCEGFERSGRYAPDYLDRERPEAP